MAEGDFSAVVITYTPDYYLLALSPHCIVTPGDHPAACPNGWGGRPICKHSLLAIVYHADFGDYTVYVR